MFHFLPVLVIIERSYLKHLIFLIGYTKKINYFVYVPACMQRSVKLNGMITCIMQIPSSLLDIYSFCSTLPLSSFSQAKQDELGSPYKFYFFKITSSWYLLDILMQFHIWLQSSHVWLNLMQVLFGLSSTIFPPSFQNHTYPHWIDKLLTLALSCSLLLVLVKSILRLNSRQGDDNRNQEIHVHNDNTHLRRKPL